MKPTILRCLFVSTSLLAIGACGKSTPGQQAQTPIKSEGDVFGAGVANDVEVSSISAILADPSAYDGKTVRVQGVITDVCANRGCWFKLAGDTPTEVIMFKVVDGEMVFPVDSKGRTATAQGTVAVSRLSVEETRAHAAHFAKDAGKEFDPTTITEGSVNVRIDGTGAVFK